MYNPTYFTQSEVNALRNAFSTMNSNSEDLQILDDVLSTPGMTIINTTDHLGTYGDAVEDVPGIKAYFDEKMTSSSSDDDSSNTLLIVGGIVVVGLVGAIFMYIRSSKEDDSEERTSTVTKNA